MRLTRPLSLRLGEPAHRRLRRLAARHDVGEEALLNALLSALDHMVEPDKLDKALSAALTDHGLRP